MPHGCPPYRILHCQWLQPQAFKHRHALHKPCPWTMQIRHSRSSSTTSSASHAPCSGTSREQPLQSGALHGRTSLRAYAKNAHGRPCEIGRCSKKSPCGHRGEARTAKGGLRSLFAQGWTDFEQASGNRYGMSFMKASHDRTGRSVRLTRH